MNLNSKTIFRSALALLLTAGPLAAQESATDAATNAAAAPASATTTTATNAVAADASDNRLDIRSFQIIQQRNIFNPNRRAIRARDNTPRVQVDYFTLRGTMTYEDKGYAFFEGSSSQYGKTVSASDTIADYKIAEITNNIVKLVTSGNQTVSLRNGMQMRREDRGPWKLVSNGVAPVTEGSAAGSSDAPGADAGSSSMPSLGGGLDDVMKKLMEKRAAEMKESGGTPEPK